MTASTPRLANDRWWLWVVVAVGLEAYALLPSLGQEVVLVYGWPDVGRALVWHLGFVGGAMFRAGMVYARRPPPVGPVEGPDHPDAPA